MNIKQLKNRLCSTWGVCKIRDGALAFILSEFSKELQKENNVSVIEWVDFDGNIKNSPEPLKDCLVKTNWATYVAFLKRNNECGWFETTEGKNIELSVVTRWAYLPTPAKGEVK